MRSRVEVLQFTVVDRGVKIIGHLSLRDFLAGMHNMIDSHTTDTITVLEGRNKVLKGKVSTYSSLLRLSS